MLSPIPFILSSCTVFSYIAHPPRTPIPIFIVIITSYCELFYLLSFPLLRSVLTVPNTPSIAFSTTPTSLLRSRALTGCPGVRHLFLYVSQVVDIMTERLRISVNLWVLMYVCPFPSLAPLCPLRRIPFCCSRGHVYISVRLIIYIPILLFTLLSYYSSLLRELGLIRSGQHNPAPRHFYPRGDPRGVDKRLAITHENEITFIVSISSREYQYITDRSPLLPPPRTGVGGGFLLSRCFRSGYATWQMRSDIPTERDCQAFCRR